MKVLSTNQYNEGVGKSKLLTTAGIGSIITSKLGYYILVSDINKWQFVTRSQKLIFDVRQRNQESSWYDKAIDQVQQIGLDIIDDNRLIAFLKSQQDLPNLLCLISVPHMALDERFNSPQWKNHPIRKIVEGGKAEDYMVLGTHFPKWFLNNEGLLRPYNQWKTIWRKEKIGLDYFAPPRDANTPRKDSSNTPLKHTIHSESQGKKEITIYTELSQTNLILICPNGHLSDIPWPKYLKWKSLGSKGNAEDLLSLDDCCTNPKLKWTESKTKSEGYSSVYIECLNCKCGSGSDGNEKVTLEGINNLKPYCKGEKPWEVSIELDDSPVIPSENCFKASNLKQREQMQVTLVTSNNVYFSNSFSSIYLPQALMDNRSPDMVSAKNLCENKFQKYQQAMPGITKKDFWDRLDKVDFLIENAFNPADSRSFLDQLEDYFLETTGESEIGDPYDEYRRKEYECFTTHNDVDKDGIRFNEVEIPQSLRSHFSKISQIHQLSLNSVQLDFTRVRPKERIRVDDQIIVSTEGQNVFSLAKDEVFVLPAVKSKGEGIFFQFTDEYLEKWVQEHESKLSNRFQSFFHIPDLNAQGASTRQKIVNNGFKHFVIHTFAHVLMRELEFSCGYPTASLKERLYISSEMSGVLIYTSEGMEGSMGGLVWQGQSFLIEDLIVNAIRRSVDCTVDPLCWQSEGQGILDLNLAACFSCALVSETSCEEFNVGLDRRVLCDNEFGFFKEFLG